MNYFTCVDRRRCYKLFLKRIHFREKPSLIHDVHAGVNQQTPNLSIRAGQQAKVCSWLSGCSVHTGGSFSGQERQFCELLTKCRTVCIMIPEWERYSLVRSSCWSCRQGKVCKKARRRWFLIIIISIVLLIQLQSSKDAACMVWHQAVWLHHVLSL